MESTSESPKRPSRTPLRSMSRSLTDENLHIRSGDDSTEDEDDLSNMSISSSSVPASSILKNVLTAYPKTVKSPTLMRSNSLGSEGRANSNVFEFDSDLEGELDLIAKDDTKFATNPTHNRSLTPNYFLRDNEHILRKQHSFSTPPSPVRTDGTEQVKELTQIIKSDASPESFNRNWSNLPWDKISNWITSLCVVTFDLTQGQIIESMIPELELSDSEKKAISFSAFPDNNSSIGDSYFSFRLRRHDQPLTSPSINQPVQVASLPKMDDEYWHGYVFFRQKPDKSIRRGYYQKSVVLLSKNPYCGLFLKMLELIGPKFCEQEGIGSGDIILQTACADIGQWPFPKTGLHELPFFGSVFTVRIPLPLDPEILETSGFNLKQLKINYQLISSSLYTSVYPVFRDILEHLWTCWELVLMNEPIAVISTCPTFSSQAVCGLVDLIKPIPYGGDYRPYFTIQDPDFKYMTKNMPPPKAILGCTNPFFYKAFERWPHIIRVGPPRLSKLQSRMQNQKTSRSPASSLDFVQGVTSKHRRFVGRDKELLKIVAAAALKGNKHDHLINNLIRKHFVILTEKFLAPLNEYFAKLMPAKLTLIPSKYPPELKSFQQQAFLRGLQEQAAPFSVKTRLTGPDWTELYRLFLKSGNFTTWLEVKISNAYKSVQDQYVELMNSTDIAKWSKGKHELQMLDLLLRLRDVVNTFPLDPSHPPSPHSNGSQNSQNKSHTYSHPPTTVQLAKLKEQYLRILSSLPEDLRISLPEISFAGILTVDE
ncbi:hypothetical protein BKA69DRAFT_1121963 [Paraphysoderma sedebokerense]|nr:hypothetical protein BKA69DRAFT_1121963 [Paraphysoderma sedebokerense]